MNWNEIKDYISQNEIEQILENGLRKIFNNKTLNIEQLKNLLTEIEFLEIPRDISYFEKSISDIKINLKKYDWIYDLLNDEKSKSVFVNMIRSKVFLDPKFIEYAYSCENIYFDNSIIGKLNEEVYLDCGGYTGDTALKFIANCPNYKKIYVFEPIREIIEKAKNNLKYFIEEGDLKLFEFATSNEAKTLMFDMGNLNGDSRESADGKIEINAVRIDDVIKDDVTFIKMDIEGSEKDAIVGAEKIIKNNTPKMAICVYHKPDDFWKIPELILSINKGYDFYLRQHDSEVYSETVLYCIPKDNVFYSNQKIKNKLEKRLEESIKQLYIYDGYENNNIVQHIKDKKWFLSQLRNYSVDVKNKDNTLDELNRYIKELIEAKEWLESQLENYKLEINNKDLVIEDLNEYVKDLVLDKEWFEENLRKQIMEIDDFRIRVLELENSENTLKNELSKIQYKMNTLLTDKIINTVIKLKKYNI